MIFRIISALILLISACALPFYITLLLGLLFAVLFKNCYELVPIFFINDALYGFSWHYFFGFHYVMTLIAIFLVVFSVFFRKYIFEGSFIRA